MYVQHGGTLMPIAFIPKISGCFGNGRELLFPGEFGTSVNVAQGAAVFMVLKKV